MQDIGVSLQITLLGMGLVFGAIILITLMMNVLVRLTSPQEQKPQENSATADLAGQGNPSEKDESLQVMKKKAAAAAVACLLAMEQRSSLPNPIRASRPRPISPWQAAQRGQQLNQRGRTR